MNCRALFPRFRKMRRQWCCIPFATVDVVVLAEWISMIHLGDWPQLNGRPTIVLDRDWHGFGAMTDGVVAKLLSEHFAGCMARGHMLSCVMPQRSIAAHIDPQPDDWFCRVHVPLVSNPEAVLVCDGEENVLEVGTAYMVNTERLHAIHNRGTSPRVHFMFDVGVLP